MPSELERTLGFTLQQLLETLTTLPALTNCETLWFEDAAIVLKASIKEHERPQEKISEVMSCLQRAASAGAKASFCLFLSESIPCLQDGAVLAAFEFCVTKGICCDESPLLRRAAYQLLMELLLHKGLHNEGTVILNHLWKGSQDPCQEVGGVCINGLVSAVRNDWVNLREKGTELLGQWHNRQEWDQEDLWSFALAVETLSRVQETASGTTLTRKKLVFDGEDWVDLLIELAFFLPELIGSIFNGLISEIAQVEKCVSTHLILALIRVLSGCNANCPLGVSRSEVILGLSKVFGRILSVASPIIIDQVYTQILVIRWSDLPMHCCIAICQGLEESGAKAKKKSLSSVGLATLGEKLCRHVLQRVMDGPHLLRSQKALEVCLIALWSTTDDRNACAFTVKTVVDWLTCQSKDATFIGYCRAIVNVMERSRGDFLSDCHIISPLVQFIAELQDPLYQDEAGMLLADIFICFKDKLPPLWWEYWERAISRWSKLQTLWQYSANNWNILPVATKKVLLKSFTSTKRGNVEREKLSAILGPTFSGQDEKRWGINDPMDNDAEDRSVCRVDKKAPVSYHEESDPCSGRHSLIPERVLHFTLESPFSACADCE